ncbi:MAG: hypothetical protein ABR953_10435 [Candidatus Acidiferrales bacterium]
MALGLKAIKESKWAEEIAQGLETVRVAVQPAAVEHMVKIGDFKKWMAREGGKPADRWHVRIRIETRTDGALESLQNLVAQRLPAKPHVNPNPDVQNPP